MNKYPEWWEQTVTVYNKFEDPQTRVITWHKTILENCFWKNTGNKITLGETVIDTNETICRIPKNDMFLENYLWVALPNDEMSNYFTLSNGDILVRGSVEEDINEYQSGHRSSDFLIKYKKLQGCMVVDKVAINTGKGRGDEHYYASGV
jgi:hypothetical protein